MQRTESAAAPPATTLETEHLSVHFGNRSALEDVNLTIREREIVCLVGPNGAGKSTLLRALAGILPPSHGYVRLNESVLNGPDSELVYIPQRTSVDWAFPVSVLEVVLMAKRDARSRLLPYGAVEKSSARDALAAVGMSQYADVQISKLSGGQQQRVFLARALLDAGSIYLLDEPFTGVDAPTQRLVIDLLHTLCASGKSVVFATHDLDQAANAAGRVVLLNRRVIADGPTDATLTLENLRRCFGSAAASDTPGSWAVTG